MPDALTDRFRARFGPGPVRVVRSPGRVNLIGEHVDYSDGFVCPMAIEPHITLAFRPRPDGRCTVVSALKPDEPVTFDANADLKPIEPRKTSWGNYVLGPAAELRRELKNAKLAGVDALMDNTLPPGAGLSSSAALEVGFAVALLAASGLDLDRARLAEVCQRAEHNFPGVPCGIMDQSIVARGKAGHAMLLDCRTLEVRHLPLAGDVLVAITDSKSPHALTGGGYAARRASCEAGVAALRAVLPGITALRDVTPAELRQHERLLDDLTYRRCRHAVGEIERTPRFADLLAAGDYVEAGRLMYASHASLQADYEVSTDELDALVEAARGVPGVYGSRLTGAGFGGCTVTLLRPDAEAAFRAKVSADFKARFKIEPPVFTTRAADGAAVQ